MNQIYDAVSAEANGEHPYPGQPHQYPADAPPMHQRVTQHDKELAQLREQVQDLQGAVNAIRGVVARELNIT